MRKILIVDDNQDIRENIAELLVLANYEVSVADGGRQALQILEIETPDLIVCDIMMPDIDGYSLLNILAQKPSTARIPFVFLSAKSESEDVRKGMNLGADDYLTKPFEGSQLLETIKSRLSRSDNVATAHGIMNSFDALKKIQKMDSITNLKTNHHKRLKMKSEFVFRESESCHSLFYLKKGLVRLYKSNTLGREVTTELVGPDTFFGFASLLSKNLHEESAEVLYNSELFVVPSEDFFGILNEDRDMMRFFLGLVAENLLEKNVKLLSILGNTAIKRTAEVLVEIYEKTKSETVLLPRNKLSQVVGVANESGGRALKKLIQKGLISAEDYGKIEILNIVGLRNLKF